MPGTGNKTSAECRAACRQENDPLQFRALKGYNKRAPREHKEGKGLTQFLSVTDFSSSLFRSNMYNYFLQSS